MIRRVLDFIYPSLCELCDAELQNGQSLCAPCLGKLPRIQSPFCRKCGEPFDGNLEEEFDCPNCHGITHDFDFAIAPLKGEGTAFHLVQALKYQRRFYLSSALASILSETWHTDPRLQDLRRDDVIVIPVPLHWRRKQWRQGNQAYELAREFCTQTKLPLQQALRRIRATSTQTKLNRKERLTNLRGAFRIRKSALAGLQGSTIILVDDVFTTGATAHECTKLLLKDGGARKVIILTLVRG
ncbi:ComF family protein [Akkermansiaceae bacterium]|nr:ComF family protein [Akkermansiaceae bacterium]